MAIVARPDQVTTVRLLPTTVATLGADIRRLDVATENIAPSTQNWVTPDDALLVFHQSSVAGVQIQVLGRVLLWDGTISFYGGTFTTFADRLIYNRFFTLQYGFLLGATCYSFGTPIPLRGQTLCALNLVRSPASNTQIHYGLGMDYLTRDNTINWPYSRIISGIEGPGILSSILGTAPAAGAEFSQTVPTNARWRLRGCRVQFTTSAAVATRFVNLAVDDGANTFYLIPSPTSFAASASPTIDFVAGLGASTTAGQDFVATLPGEIPMLAGWRVRSFTTSLQAGDQYGAPRFFVEEVIEG